MTRQTIPATSELVATAMQGDELIERLPAFLTFGEVADRILRLGRTAAYAIAGTDGFPVPIALGGRARVYRTAEVLAWVDSRPRAKREEPLGPKARRQRLGSPQ